MASGRGGYRCLPLLLLLAAASPCARGLKVQTAARNGGGRRLLVSGVVVPAAALAAALLALLPLPTASRQCNLCHTCYCRGHHILLLSSTAYLPRLLNMRPTALGLQQGCGDIPEPAAA